MLRSEDSFLNSVCSLHQCHLLCEVVLVVEQHGPVAETLDSLGMVGASAFTRLFTSVACSSVIAAPGLNRFSAVFIRRWNVPITSAAWLSRTANHASIRAATPASCSVCHYGQGWSFRLKKCSRVLTLCPAREPGRDISQTIPRPLRIGIIVAKHGLPYSQDTLHQGQSSCIIALLLKQTC